MYSYGHWVILIHSERIGVMEKTSVAGYSVCFQTSLLLTAPFHVSPPIQTRFALYLTLEPSSVGVSLEDLQCGSYSSSHVINGVLLRLPLSLRVTLLSTCTVSVITRLLQSSVWRLCYSHITAKLVCQGHNPLVQG